MQCRNNTVTANWVTELKCLFLKILFIKRERNINVWLPLMRPAPGTWPTTQACALPGNQTSDLLAQRPALSSLSHGSQGWNVQSIVRKEFRSVHREKSHLDNQGPVYRGEMEPLLEAKQWLAGRIFRPRNKQGQRQRQESLDTPRKIQGILGIHTDFTYHFFCIKFFSPLTHC